MSAGSRLAGAARPARLARYARAVAVLLIVAACQPQVYQIPIPPTRVVDIGRAAKAFSDICLATAPGFRAAPERFARHGLTDRRPDGVVYDTSGTLSVRVDGVQTSQGPKMRCSVVYQDPNRFIVQDRVDRLVRSAPGRMRGLRTARFPASDGGYREGRAWTYATGGRTGDFLDVPYVGAADLGVLILQFPALR